jgi:hypothetical protein
VRQQVPERDRRFGITQSRRAISIEALQHFHPYQWQYVAHRLFETDTALFGPLLIRMQRMHPAKFPAILELHPTFSRRASILVF